MRYLKIPANVAPSPWYDHCLHPARPGYYRVRGQRLVGSPYRYFDGAMWLTYKGGHRSIFGSRADHAWQGLARRASYRAKGGTIICTF